MSVKRVKSLATRRTDQSAALLALCELVDDPQWESNAKNFTTIYHEVAFMYGTEPNSLIGACSWQQWQGQCAMLCPWIHENIHHIYRNSRIHNPHPSTICNVYDVPVNEGTNAWLQHHKYIESCGLRTPRRDNVKLFGCFITHLGVVSNYFKNCHWPD